MAPVLKYCKLSANAKAPVRSSAESAGFDLCSAVTAKIPKRSRALIYTDLSVQIPEGCYGRIAPRSKMANECGIDVGAGVVDRDYTGNIGVILFNHSNDNFYVNRGDRIAQLICERIELPTLEEDPSLVNRTTGRGARGLRKRTFVDETIEALKSMPPSTEAVPDEDFLDLLVSKRGTEYEKWLGAIDAVMPTCKEVDPLYEMLKMLYQNLFETQECPCYTKMLEELYDKLATDTSAESKIDATFIDKLHSKMCPQCGDGFDRSDFLVRTKKWCDVVVAVLGYTGYDHHRDSDKSKMVQAVKELMKETFEEQADMPTIERFIEALRTIQRGPHFKHFDATVKELGRNCDGSVKTSSEPPAQ